MTYLLCDLSEYQPSVQFDRLRAAGVAGVMIRASYGRDGLDHLARAHVNGARAAGLRVGLYHYAYPALGNTPTREAEQFVLTVRALGGIHRRDLRPMLDLEDGQARPDYAVWARRWLSAVHQQLGVGPLVYSYGPFLAGLRLTVPLGYGLVLAAYGRNDGADHPVDAPPPWRQYVAHQFTSTGRLPGVLGPVDLWHARKLRPLLSRPLLGL